MVTLTTLVVGGLVFAAATFGAVPNSLAADANLYEVTENMKVKSLRTGQQRRQAASALTGTAVAGSPLCPMPIGAPPCVVNVTGSDDIDIASGLGTFKGKWSAVVQGDNLVDAPEYEIAKGKFDGVMDFSPALVYGLPYGTVTGVLKIDKVMEGFPFTGVFSLPFVWPGDPSRTPLYLGPQGPVPVQPNEFAIGFPAVKFEITFGK